MNIYLLGFMTFCLVLGLWIKPRVRYGVALIALAAFLLVFLFLYSPSKM
jgi:uncharacterized membrane protein